MVAFNKNKGFTLIETLVAINLSFIALTVIISFFLFAKNFSESLSRNYINKYLQISFFNNVENALRNSDNYFINIGDNKTIIKTNNEDSIYFAQDSIALNTIFFISKIEKTEISITTDTDADIVIRNGELVTNPTSLLNENKILESNRIHSISFQIIKNKMKYSYQIFSPAVSVTHFKNLFKEEYSDINQ